MNRTRFSRRFSVKVTTGDRSIVIPVTATNAARAELTARTMAADIFQVNQYAITAKAL